MTADLKRFVTIVRRVQAMPYAWPSQPDAVSARAAGEGSCASKHALLAEELAAIGLQSLPLLVVGSLVPKMLKTDPELAPGEHLAEAHECLTVLTPWAGPLRVDVTWDPALIRHSLPGTLDWDGRTDMLLAVGEGGPCWSVPRERLRDAKEALRSRLYRPGRTRVARSCAGCDGAAFRAMARAHGLASPNVGIDPFRSVKPGAGTMDNKRWPGQN